MISLQSNDIHLWLIRDEEIADELLLLQYRGLLSSEERAQQERFYFAKHRHQYLITRAVLRNLLSRYEPLVTPFAWRFETNKYGKPRIHHSIHSPVRFNISHCEKLIAIAICKVGNIGVDVEYVDRDDKVLDVAKSYFSPKEVKCLSRLPRNKKVERFFDLWTLKEAYIKACGMGLSIPLDHFSFDIDGKNISIEFVPERNDNPGLWQFWQETPGTQHKLSLAIKNERAEDRAFKITMRDYHPCQYPNSTLLVD